MKLALLAAPLLLLFFTGCKGASSSAAGASNSGVKLTDSSAEPAPVQSASESALTASKGGSREVAIFAGGCFWGMEELLRSAPGVLDTEVGYAGGTLASPTYSDVKTGNSGHAESVQITFDKTKLSYRSLLKDWFFKIHDPTTVNRQGNDRGTQYRSVIFYLNDEQKQTAKTVIAEIDKNGSWGSKIVTRLEAATSFTPAESYHQDYLQNNPRGYTCHYARDDLTF